MSKIGKSGLIILIMVLFLSTLGVFQVYSASRIWAFAKFGDSFFYLKRQFAFFMIGLFVMFLGIRLDTKILYKYYRQILITGIILLILVLIPGLGIIRNGSRSWFGIGNFAVQPAEVFKACIIIYAATYFAENYKKTNKFFKGIFPVLFFTFVGFALIMLQPDLGSGIVMVISVVIMSIISRQSLKNYLKLGLLGIVSFVYLIISEPYRIKRITAFVNPWEDPLGSGFQIIQSMYALGPGGFLGSGIDGSMQKHFYLPEPQTDFIFAILAEEFGFIGGVIVIFAFGVIIYQGLQIAKKALSKSDSFLAIGITSLIAIQTIINLGVVVGLLPVTGITLPYLSYGGSSLVIIMGLSGILIGLDKKKSLKEDT